MKLKPLMSIKENKPLVTTARDEHTHPTQQRTLGRGMLVGALGLTYPSDIIIAL